MTEEDDLISQILNEAVNMDANNILYEGDTDNLLNSILNENISENNENKEKVEMKENQNKSQKKIFQNFYPPFKNPLDFVQYLEVERIYRQISIEMKNFFLNNEIKKNNKYNISQIKYLFNINGILSKLSVNIIIAKHTNLIVNTNDGQFLFFSLQHEKLIKKIKPKKLNSSKITCFDVTDDYNYMLVGFQDGTVILININSEEIIYTNILIHKLFSLIELKIYKKEQNELSFISTSINGKIFLNYLKIGGISSLFKKIETIEININNTSPIFLVKFIQLSQENQKLLTNYKNLKKYVILGSIESIWVYCLDPIKEVFEIKKPNFIKETVVPDAQIGLGFLPDISTRFVKKDKRNHLLLIISWGKIIYFYQIQFKDEESIENYKEIGNYINLFNILRIGFMNNSVIYILDNSFSIKTIDSSKINPEKITLNKENPVIPNKNNLAEIEKSRLVSRNISSQKILNKNKNEKEPINSYLYSIVESKDLSTSVVVLGDNQIYLVDLPDWLSFLEYLQKVEAFIQLFSLGIQLFKGKIMFFSNIPDEKIRKQKISDKLIEFIKGYLDFNIKKNKNNELLGDCIKIAIELFIEIKAFDILINTILPYLDSNNYGDLFLYKLEPFILCDKLKSINLSTELILRLIDLYNKKGKLGILSQMLLHINIQSLDTFKIRKKLEDLNLFTPLIYLYTNGKNEDYILPIEKMFEFFNSKAISNKTVFDVENNAINYSKALNQNLLTEKDVRESKEYIGHKILWYIRLCLTKQKFPDNTNKIEKEQYEKLVPRIAYWLLSPKVIDELLSFDSKNYIMIFKNIFTIIELKNIIVKAAKDEKYTTEIINMLSTSDIKIENIEPDSMMKYLIEWCKKKNLNADIYKEFQKYKL